ncbi:MAG TPA: hypothetical protein VGD60_10790 [Candidatus Acidoferrales bacterium]
MNNGNSILKPTESWKYLVLFAVVAAMAGAMFLIQPIPQSETYHHFADTRSFGIIPNYLNVLSNLFFLIAGVLGMRLVLREQGPALFIEPAEKWPYFLFFLGVALTTFGSGYYHAAPGDARLVWDRLPMTIGFMSLLAATIDERIGVKAGLRSLAPLVILGLASVLYWNFTQQRGQGDLRPYALVQFGSLVTLLLLVGLFPPRYTRGADLIVALGIYVASKIFEALDSAIFSVDRIVSGHSLKHVAAAISAYWIYRMLKLRSPIAARQN